MSIDHLKKQAKNLKAFLPTFLEAHPSGTATLADFQELVARISGYPSWHAALQRRTEATSDTTAPNASAPLGITVSFEGVYVSEYTSKGVEKPAREIKTAVFYPDDQERHDEVVAQLDDFLDEQGTSDDYGEEGPPEQYSRELVRLCRKLIDRDPSFIDGYAHLCSALYWLGEFEAAIGLARPLFDRVSALLPTSFRGRVSYLHLENRPFHRLAHGLVLAYYSFGSAEGNKQAGRLAKRMLRWWPNDNIGFRFLLKPPHDE